MAEDDSSVSGASFPAMDNAISLYMSKGLRNSPFLTMRFAVVGVDRQMRETLCDQLVKLSEWPEFRPCTSNSFESVEALGEVPSIQNNLLCVVILDITSLMSCTSVNSWLESLRNQQCTSRVCVIVHNAHKVAEYAYPADYIQNLRTQKPSILLLFHGLDQGKWQPLVAQVLRWGEIASGFRGSMTTQYLRSVLQPLDPSKWKANCLFVKD
ncbi:uncharacterized protein LOC119452828 [Dermacentor silvarum]|uniref:uncharacterized protein LOC119452828 n=1 Tax=Dermacentor silvarum TaxID=543639 RepID=UPI001897FB53|nr:uncharacterized protein LOC119452828 [Dermacentor silvarum]